MFSIQLISNVDFRSLDALALKQIPFATAKTLTNLAQLSVLAIKEEVANVFILRNKFTVNSIRYEKATKQNQVSTVFTASSYLPLQIEGGTKRAGSKRFGIPKREGLGVALNRVIPERKRVKNIINSFVVHKWESVIKFERGKKGKPNKLVYVLRRTAEVKPILDFAGIVRLTVDANYRILFNRNLEQAIDTAK